MTMSRKEEEEARRRCLTPYLGSRAAIDRMLHVKAR
jgi:hypothetical protein